MNVLIHPRRLSGSVVIPPSKSQSHRAIIAASLSKGKSVINNITMNEDVVATIAAMEKIGVKITQNNRQLVIHGVNKIQVADDNIIDCNESGSTIRFLIPLLSLSKHKIVMTGKPTLFKRPMLVYEKLFSERGLYYAQNEKSIIINGNLSCGLYRIPGNISSQFFSGLMFALPLLKDDSVIEIEGELESRDYIEMTIDMLARFGVKVIQENNRYLIPGNQHYTAAHITIEGDYSQMAFFGVAGLLGGDITCQNMIRQSLQPDRRILDFVNDMNGSFDWNDQRITFHYSTTFGSTIDLSQSPDIGPILAILAAFSEGYTTLVNAQRLKYKESNRLLAMYETLEKMGVESVMGDSSLQIKGTSLIEGGHYDSYGDHRIVMALAIAAIRAKSPLIIHHAEAVSKSYPSFFEDYQKLGGMISFLED